MTYLDDYEKSVKKYKKRLTLNTNKFKGKLAENTFELQERAKGNDVRRVPHGRDYVVTHRDPFTRKYIKTTHDEVKSSPTAPLSDLQKTEKKRLGSRYRVHRSWG
jgi:hypothetical protein